MGMMDKLRDFMGMPEDEEDEFYEEETQDDEMDYTPIRKRKDKETSSYDLDDSADSSKRPNKVVNIAATTQLSVVLVKPETFDDASSIADHLNAKRTVVLNLESASKEVSRRLVDFLSGVAYANQGQIKRVANSTFIITPYNVDFVGDLLDELESNGVYF
jgi:cell division inhibitor SepF